MNREEKADLLSELNELFNGAEVIVVSHYKGLTVKEVSELRNNVRKAGAGFRVTKNRITRLALKGTKFESLADLFKGPTAIAFANDPISACKACVEFAKTNEKLILVGGAMGTGVLSLDEIKRLATIPSMDELRAKNYRPVAGSCSSAGESYEGLQRKRSRIIFVFMRFLPVIFLLCSLFYTALKNNFAIIRLKAKIFPKRENE